MTRLLAAAVAAAVAVSAAARADDAAAARALVDKGIKAHGGADALAKFKGSVVGFKGTVHAMGTELPITGEITSDGPDRVKADMEVEAGGQKFRVVNVVAGDKGWAKLPGMDTKALGKAELDEARANAHTAWVATLAPLVKGKGYALAPAGELLVNDKAAVGVKVTAKGRRDVTLYFDKATGLLARYDSVVTDEGTGREVPEETYPTEYKDVQGTKQAVKFLVKRDGKTFLEGEATAHQLSETIDPAAFARP